MSDVKISHEDRVKFLKREIEQLDKKIFKDAQGNIVPGQTRARYLLILKDLLEMIEPTDKPSGTNWGKDSHGNFTLSFYMMKSDMDEMNLPPNDASMVNELLRQNTSPSVLNGLAIIAGHWLLQHDAEKKKLAAHVAIEGGVDAVKH